MSGLDPATVVGAALATGTLVTGAAVGVFHPRATLFGPVIWRGPAGRASVALTFDDGPDPESTARIAEVLDEYRVPATFFCIGRKLDLHPSLATSLHRSGHQLANHTYAHNLGRDLFSARHLAKDLRRCQDVLGSLTGGASPYYRPAVGIRNPPVHAAARAVGLTVVTWTHAARDGVLAFTPRRALALAARASAGSILALHDGQLHGSPSLRGHTVRNLPHLLKGLADRGFAFQTLTELLRP
jgi:peptidoglycan/xylan/chitin deacetylase (PgdA/CDA1 family)